MTENQILKIYQPKWYEVDVDKLSRATMKDIAHLLASLRVSETYDYFEIVKPFLKIPEEPKSLEEIQQELNDKLDKLLAETKRKFAVSQENAEYYYNKKFNKIDENFEDLKKYGHLPFFTNLYS